VADIAANFDPRVRHALVPRSHRERDRFELFSRSGGKLLSRTFCDRVLCIFLPTLSGDDRRGPSGNLLFPWWFAWLLSAVLLLFLFLENLIAEPRRRL